MRRLLVIALLGVLVSEAASPEQPAAPLRLIQAIPLDGVEGRIDEVAFPLLIDVGGLDCGGIGKIEEGIRLVGAVRRGRGEIVGRSPAVLGRRGRRRNSFRPR